MEVKAQNEARACLEAIRDLCTEFDRSHLLRVTESQIAPLRVLLDHAEELVNGKAEARDRKNAGDRKRRAKKKTPATKAKKKNLPRPPTLRELEAPPVR